jgi:hypothetical protein
MKVLMDRLTCFFRGHESRRLNGSLFIVCDRCDAILRLRVGGWREEASQR